MAFKEAEVYRCPEAECGCEIKVTKGAAPGHSRRISGISPLFETLNSETGER